MTHKHPFEHNVPKPTENASVSWWISVAPAGFTAFVEREQFQRMKLSRFGLTVNKPYSTNEVSR